MPDQIYIGNFAKGLKTNPLPFNIDNDAFPVMFNFYSWRGRAKRKRGTILLGQLERQIQSVLNATPPATYQVGQLTLSSGALNLFSTVITNITQATQAVVTISGSIFGLGDLVTVTGVTGMTQINGGSYMVTAISPTSMTLNVNTTTFTPYASGGIATLISENPQVASGTISFTVAGNTYTESTATPGLLIGTPSGTGTINYSTGAVTIVGGGSSPLTGNFAYYPNIPVMGLEDFISASSNNLYPLLLAFDTTYAYQLNQTGTTRFFYSVSYYKGTNVPVSWSAPDFQQFFTTNYTGAFWATNNKPGFNFLNGTATTQTGTVLTFNFKTIGANFTTLVIGDQLFLNEWTSPSTVNGLVGVVSSIAGAASGNYSVTFMTSQTVTGTGIVQLLTNQLIGQDGIKWYDGDPTSGTGIPSSTGLGWVNFAPPLTGSGSVSVDGLAAQLYYLVGALAIVGFKDRLLFFSPWIQSSSGAPIQLFDVVIWSWNGTPYYNSYVPAIGTGIQTSNIKAFYVDQTGLGGYVDEGHNQPIATVANNEDVLLVGFGGDGRKTRFVYTGNDIDPFLFFTINSELPSTSTFSSITLDKGAIDIGQYGFAVTDQQSSQRLDLDIPDSVFQIQALNNGAQRVNAVRDFYREWIYFAYPIAGSQWKYPTQTFLYNYRDATWGILYENFTAHGSFRPQMKKSWLTTGFHSWNQWREAWNSGSNSPQFPSIIAGNPQGYVLIKGSGTAEASSGTIAAVAAFSGVTQITSVNHCTQVNDYLQVVGTTGLAASFNESIGKVIMIVDINNFVIDIPFPTGTYLGLGTFIRLSQPLLLTKQFPMYWEQGRQVRLSAQKYLFDFTSSGQVTINIFLSMDQSSVWNNPVIDGISNALVYTQTLFTCPEAGNIGLTPPNYNLQMPTAETQKQIWHRFNTSLIGDTFQIGVTLNDTQMRNITYATSEITLHGMHLTVSPGPHLS